MPNLKFALRTLFKTPFVTIVAIVSLALGIGANAAIFSLFNQILLQPLPVRGAERLVNLVGARPEAGSQNSCSQAGDCDDGVQLRDVPRPREASQTPFTGIAAHRAFGANLSARGQTHERRGHARLGQLLSGARPARRRIGRLLTPDDDRAPGESHVVVLGYACWQTRFARRPERAQPDR